MELTGKTALVTGASRGLGRAIAERLASAGALVAVNYAENRVAAEETVARIAAAGGQAFAVQARLGGIAGAQQLAARLDEELAARTGAGQLDILVNNIGGGDYGRILDVDEAAFDQAFGNNVRAAFFLTRALHGRLAASGRVVNLSSTGSRLTDPGIIVYTMAKAAVDAFTRVLAAELGPRGITVNSVAPGFTAGETNAHVTEDPEAARQVTEATALRRFGTPEEIADIVYALASPLGRWVTAQNIEASGGFRL
ncbi:SDR family NAD(P)-dependent oxidoreductase [Novosphingobium soli]|uniref:SDR family NAD(P)-dependent oxidoreductase n=1 Tax=Novosphingobium soli TaxID=574956 RepID=A0ABV6CXL7_9SPHN